MTPDNDSLEPVVLMAGQSVDVTADTIGQVTTVSSTTTLPPSMECGDANGDAVISATDALILLRIAVGQMQSLACPACP